MVPRSIQSAMDSITALNRPPRQPAQVAQAKTGATDQMVGSVASPASMRAPVSTTRVISTLAHPMIRSVVSSGQRRRRGELYAHAVKIVQAAIMPMTAQPSAGRAYSEKDSA